MIFETDSYLPDVEAVMLDMVRADPEEPSGLISRQHLETGGKRLRARLALAATQSLGGDPGKSVAWAVAQILESEGAEVIYSVRNEKRLEETSKLLDGRAVHCCDVEKKEEIARLADSLQAEKQMPLDGILHSIAFANFSEGLKPFHETKREDFLQATQITAFSLVVRRAHCGELPVFDLQFSVTHRDLQT